VKRKGSYRLKGGEGIVQSDYFSTRLLRFTGEGKSFPDKRPTGEKKQLAETFWKGGIVLYLLGKDDYFEDVESFRLTKKKRTFSFDYKGEGR